MNSAFAEYSTSAAFALVLSKNQCNHMLRLDGLPEGEDVTAQVAGLLTVGSLRSLEAKGFVHWGRNEEGKPRGFMGLTKAGRLMVDLLKEAGLSVSNTNTVSMLKRLAA
jgi:hypothetical protein